MTGSPEMTPVTTPKAETRIPAEVFHASEMIADEAIARDWSIWDFADRIGALDPRQTVLEYELYALCDPDILMGDDGAMDLERVFGISADIWRRTEALCREHPLSISPLSKFARGWYGLDDDAPEFTPVRRSPPDVR